MENLDQPKGPPGKKYRKSLRLRFRFANGKVQLVSHARVEMICPPSIGEQPQAGKHDGFWIELRDAKDAVIFHRRLHLPLGHSVEVHSPDGKIHREFGEAKESIFEVLLPDEAEARRIVLFGEALPRTAKKSGKGGSKPGTAEIAEFEVPRGEGGSAI